MISKKLASYLANKIVKAKIIKYYIYNKTYKFRTLIPKSL